MNKQYNGYKMKNFKVIIVLGIIVSVLQLNLVFAEDSFFASSIELENYFDQHTDNPLKDSTFNITQINESSKWNLTLHLSTADPDDSVIFDWDKQKIIEVKGNFAGVKSIHYKIDPEKFGPPDESTYMDKRKTAYVIRYFIQKTVKEDFNSRYVRSLKKYKNKDLKRAGRYSAAILDNYYLQYYPIQSSNVDKYNDFGFFLEQSGRYKEAAKLLLEIINFFPERIVAYINLGDAYHGNHEVVKAKQAYQKYVDLMKKAGKQKRIPKRVYARLK